MNLHTPLLTLALLATTTAAQASGPTTTGALASPANRIVGSWSNVANVGPCGGATAPQRQTLLFIAGGTLVDNSRFPPNGLPNLAGIPGIHQRSIGVGVWAYNPDTGEYTLDQRFDWYVDNVYHGYQTVQRSILLSNDGQQAAGPVRSTRYAANGSTIVEICGSALSTRL